MNNQPEIKSFSAFLPVVLIAVGIITLLSWNLLLAINQHSAGVRISAQQELQMTQAAQTEQKLKAMMSDLLELSKTDKDADAIIKRYKIALNK